MQEQLGGRPYDPTLEQLCYIINDRLSLSDADLDLIESTVQIRRKCWCKEKIRVEYFGRITRPNTTSSYPARVRHDLTVLPGLPTPLRTIHCVSYKMTESTEANSFPTSGEGKTLPIIAPVGNSRNHSLTISIQRFRC